MQVHCPLCFSSSTQLHAEITGLAYWRCSACTLVFQDPERLPAAEFERSQYDLHENSVDDPAYRQFLQPVAEAVMARFEPPASGLDFGCGPGPALASMLGENGHAMALFDPIYFPDRMVLSGEYDFITCTETAEHFHHPAESFTTMFNCLKQGGSLFLMTQLLLPETDFSSWWYHRDPTHVVFYSEPTLQWLARRHAASLNIWSDRLAVFRLD